ncbi:MAG: hypothetical protein FJZ66_10405 [Bacteroidetes bacterium]|nr:hypothetical protein [Bacteroidota bacterium]
MVKRDDKTAKVDFLRVLKMDSNYQKINNILGNIYYRLAIYDSAVIFFTKVLQADQGSADYTYLRADSRFESGDFKGALDDAIRLMSLDPDNDKAPWIAGLASWELNNYSGALNYFTLCIAMDSTNANYFGFEVWSMIRCKNIRPACMT